MKINYYQRSLTLIEQRDLTHGKPRLLLHACCAPCACFPLHFLYPYFNITLYYNNSNIHPAHEYHRRLEELQRYVNQFNQEKKEQVQIIVPPYKPEQYLAYLTPLKDEPERGKRCHLCYSIRMKEAYNHANIHAFDYFTTAMTISRQKDSQIINKIGLSLQKQFPHVCYFESDFKKNEGILIANQIIKDNHLYRQNYCGCLYSFEKTKSS